MRKEFSFGEAFLVGLYFVIGILFVLITFKTATENHFGDLSGLFGMILANLGALAFSRGILKIVRSLRDE